MFELLLLCFVVIIGIIYTNKSILKSFCFLLLSYFILSYNIGFQLKLVGVHAVISFPRVYFGTFLIVYLYNRFKLKTNNSLIESKNDLLLIIFLLYIASTAFWGLSLAYDLKSFFSERWLFGFFAYFIAKDLFRTENSIFILFKYLGLSLIILSIYGILEFITAKPIMQLPPFKYLDLIDPNYESLAFNRNEEFVTRGSLLRLSGTFWNSIIFSIALTFLYPYYLLIKNYKIKYLNFGFIPLTITAILTIGRTAWYSILLAFAFNFKRYKTVTIFAVVIFLVIAIPFFELTSANDELLDKNIFSIQSRIYTLPILFEMPISQILFGNGVGSYFYAVEQSQKTDYTRLCGDNSSLQIIYTTGIFGVLFISLFMTNFFLHLKKIIKKLSRNTFDYKLIKATQIMVIIQMILFFITNSIFQDNRLLFIFLSLLGAINGYLNTVNSNKTNYY